MRRSWPAETAGRPPAVGGLRPPGAVAPRTADRIVELARAGVKVFQLCADQHGRERLDDGRPGRHIKDALREVHGRLVKEGLRDEVTLDHLRRHRSGRAHGQGDHLRGRPGGGGYAAAGGSGLPRLPRRPPVRRSEDACPAEIGFGRVRLRCPAHGQSDGRVAQPAHRGAGRHGHPRGPPPAWRSGTSHLHGRHREGGIRRSGPRVSLRCV